jgi:signal transduction histidine kinase
MFLLLGTALILGIYVLSSGDAALQTHSVAVSAAPQAVVKKAGGGVSIAVPGAPPRIVKQIGPGDGSSSRAIGLFAASWLLLVITAIASAVLGWFLAGRVLQPLRQMTDTARTISAGSLGRRLALAGPDDEFRRLGDTLDDLLGRLETAFDAQRRFVANASHELRTPLTVERTLLQVALADPHASEASLRATCEEILACGREHERLLEALLTLASSERALGHREPVDLAQLAGRVLRAPRPDLQRDGLELSTHLEPAAVAGDPALIERLMANLIDNAVRYNEPGGRVDVRTASVNGHAVMTVTNTGPVVPVQETDRLFEPFRRLGADRTAAAAEGHHGLGLSIVRAIAVAHDAAIEVVAQPAGGLVVTVSFARLPDAG